LKATSRGSFHAAASGSHRLQLRYTFLDCMSDAEPRIYKQDEVIGIGAGSHLRKTAPCRRTIVSTAVGEQICLLTCNKQHAKYPARIREEAHQQRILSNFAECSRKNLDDIVQARGHITTRFPTMNQSILNAACCVERFGERICGGRDADLRSWLCFSAQVPYPFARCSGAF
jgi:hypothetical protein